MLDAENFPVIQTERLILRRVEEVDASDLMNYLSSSDVVKHMGLAPFVSINDALDEIAWYQSIFENNTGIRWGITLKSEGQVIGSCGFLNAAAKHYRAEVGIELSKEYWGSGIAGEAFSAVLSYGFSKLNLQRIEALIEPQNILSQKLAEKHGLLREGLLRSYEYTLGKFDDLYMYSILRPDSLNSSRSGLGGVASVV